MNPVHTMNSPPQNSFAGPTGVPFGSNMYSGYASSMAFYAQQELSSQSHQAQFQHLVPPSNSHNVNSAQVRDLIPGERHTVQPTGGTSVNGLTRNEMGLINQDNLTGLKGLVAACRANPNILNIPELTFFKEYLDSYRPQSPNKTEKQTTVYVQKKSLGKSCKIALSPIKPMEEGEDYQVQRGLMPFKCIHCGKGWTSLKNLKRHMVSHTGGDGTYKCNLCDKIFAYSSSLEYHIRAHKGVKPYPCIECDKSFSQKNRLQMHMRTHTGERPYQCNLCEKSFRQYNACRTHMLTHTEERPVPCDQCDKCFKNKDQLSKHIIRHHTHRERTFKCTECGKGFYNNNNLSQHLRKMHTEGDSYECTKCDCYFRKKRQLTKHTLRYHTPRERKFKCTDCDKAFYHNNSLKLHMKKHPEVKWDIPEDQKKLETGQEF